MPGWTEKDVERLKKQPHKKSGAPPPPSETGEIATFTAWVAGVIPAKKNRKRMMGRMLITAPAVQEELAGISRLLHAERVRVLGRNKLARFSIAVRLDVSNLGSTDPDNAVQSLIDCLREAGVIVNDNPKHSRRGCWTVVDVAPGLEGAMITVTGEIV
jgi:hypothetical protein